MKQHIQIVGDGSFGSFLKELMHEHFVVLQTKERDHVFNQHIYEHNLAHNNAITQVNGIEASPFYCPIILAVPISALHEVALNYQDRHIINVCSTQKNSNEILRQIKPNNFTGWHPLFGKRTPAEYRNSIFTQSTSDHKGSEYSFFRNYVKIGRVTIMNDEEHDKIMAATHAVAVQAAQVVKPLLEAGKDISDDLIPHSYRLLKNMVKTLDDMPSGTLQTIMSNEYIIKQTNKQTKEQRNKGINND